jgi:fructan beta-fructosidase
MILGRWTRDGSRVLAGPDETRLSPRVLAVAAMLAVAASAQVQIKPDPLEYKPSEVADQQHYRQPLRPQFHYTPIQGHIGDATGLIYYAGEYHLFNMFDAWSQKRMAHKQWGHAVSTDLIHWTQLPGLLDKLLDNSPGSGSGVVDWNDSSGLRAGPEKTLVIFYTDYKLGSCIAYSRDRGRTWTRYGKNPVIGGADDARDPTVFWYTPASEWRMVRYEKQGFAFYKSTDLLHWTWLSHIDGFYECPDMVELPIVNLPGERRWVLINATGQYMIGTFDGTKFTPQTDKLRVEYGKSLYAGQVWKKTPEGGPPAYQVFWMRYPETPRLSWIHQVSFPTELTLRSFPEGIRLCRQPIDEIDNLRIAQKRFRDIEAGAGHTPLDIAGDLLDLRVELAPSTATTFGLTVRGHQISYSTVSQKLRVGAVEAPLKLNAGKLRLRILIDRPSIEVFADEGQVSISQVVLEQKSAPAPNQGASLDAEGGKVRLVSLEANRLESIWAGHP